MFNLTFYSVDQNRSIQYPVHENMGIGIIRTRVARKIVQRQPLTVLQYHNQSLFDIKTVKDYGLNEHSDPIFVLKRKSKAHIKLELKKEKARLKKEKERLQKEKKKQKAEEKARTEALKKAEKAMDKQQEEQNNMLLIGGTAMQRSHWSDAERKAMAKLERKFAKIEKKLGEKRELAAAMRAKFERRRKNKQDPALLSRLEMALKKVETVDIPEVQKKQFKVRDQIVSLWEKAQENVERKAAQDLTALQASNATNATQQAEAVAHGKNFTKISYSGTSLQRTIRAAETQRKRHC